MNNRDDVDGAQEMFERVLAIDSNHVETLHNYSLLLMNHRYDVDGTKEMLERALDIEERLMLELIGENPPLYDIDI